MLPEAIAIYVILNNNFVMFLFQLNTFRVQSFVRKALTTFELYCAYYNVLPEAICCYLQFY